MLVCACSRADTSQCTRCIYNNLHLGVILPTPSDFYKEGYKAGYIKGASDYGGITIREEDIDVSSLTGP